MRKALAMIGVCALATGAVRAQADLPSFDAASVKVSAPLPSGTFMINGGGPPVDPGRIDYPGITLRTLIAQAYHVKEFQVQGPQWLDSERYDVKATIPKDATRDQINQMMQRLLAERFKLAVHRESKPMSVYTLSVAKGGSKLKEADPNKPFQMPPLPDGAPKPPPPPPPPTGGNGGPPRGMMRMSMTPTGRRVSGVTTLPRLCDMLTNFLDRPVIDQTGLTGSYEFDLAWTPDENERMGGKLAMPMAHGAPPPGAGPDAKGPDASDPGMPLAQALQTGLGLKLEAKRDATDLIVVDRAEKVPTEN